MCFCVGNEGNGKEWSRMVASLCGNFTFSSAFQSCLCIVFFTSRSQLCTVEICKQESVYVFSVDLGFPWNTNGVRGMGSVDTDFWTGCD